MSFTISQSLLKPMSIESVTPSNHLILCHPLLLPPSIFPSIRVFSNESVLRIRWPKSWHFSFSISPSNEYSGLTPLGLTGWISLLSKGLSRAGEGALLQHHSLKASVLWCSSKCYESAVTISTLEIGFAFFSPLFSRHWYNAWQVAGL